MMPAILCLLGGAALGFAGGVWIGLKAGSRAAAELLVDARRAGKLRFVP